LKTEYIRNINSGTFKVGDVVQCKAFKTPDSRYHCHYDKIGRIKFFVGDVAHIEWEDKQNTFHNTWSAYPFKLIRDENIKCRNEK
jgi:hypothetical protein